MNPNNKYCLACKAIGICEAESGVQKQAKKNFIEWAKANNYDKYEFVHEAIGSAFLSTSSIRHILSFGSTFYLKLDVLNNLESYLNEDIVIFDEPVEHDKEKILSVKTSIIPYKGNIEKYRKQNIEFTFRLMQDTNKYQIYDILIK